jgi:hypothetical protein
VPADLPRPPSSNRPIVALTNANLTVVQFTAQISLAEGVLFVLDQYRRAGFTLGRGDAEFNQADAPFARTGVFGQVRINGTAPCRTTWLVAIGAPSAGTSPLLAPPSTSPSPLPFGP